MNVCLKKCYYSLSRLKVKNRRLVALKCADNLDDSKDKHEDADNVACILPHSKRLFANSIAKPGIATKDYETTEESTERECQ